MSLVLSWLQSEQLTSMVLGISAEKIDERLEAHEIRSYRRISQHWTVGRSSVESVCDAVLSPRFLARKSLWLALRYGSSIEYQTCFCSSSNCFSIISCFNWNCSCRRDWAVRDTECTSSSCFGRAIACGSAACILIGVEDYRKRLSSNRLLVCERTRWGLGNSLVGILNDVWDFFSYSWRMLFVSL